MGARRAEGGAALGREGEQPTPAIALRDHGRSQILTPPGPDFDLGADQLARDRLGEHGIDGGGGLQLLEPRDEPEVTLIEDRELFFEPDREVGGCFEGRASGVDVDSHVRKWGAGQVR